METVRGFVAAGIYSGLGVNDHLRATLKNLIENGAVFLYKGGVIAGMVVPLLFNSDYRVASELCWWAPNGGGSELRRAFEEWAREQHADAVQMSAMNSGTVQRVDKIYRRAGYAAVEIGYLKELK